MDKKTLRDVTRIGLMIFNCVVMNRNNTPDYILALITAWVVSFWVIPWLVSKLGKDTTKYDGLLKLHEYEDGSINYMLTIHDLNEVPLKDSLLIEVTPEVKKGEYQEEMK